MGVAWRGRPPLPRALTGGKAPERALDSDVRFLVVHTCLLNAAEASPPNGVEPWGNRNRKSGPLRLCLLQACTPKAYQAAVCSPIPSDALTVPLREGPRM